MTRCAALLLLSLLPAPARADGAPPPGFRRVVFVCTLTVERDYPEYAFFLVNWSDGGVERLPLSPAEPVLLLPEGRTGAYRIWTVHAVPRALVDPLPGSVPGDCKWFSQQQENGVLNLGKLDFGAYALPFYDNRERVEITYRAEIGPEGGRLVKVWENAGNPWVKGGWIVAGLLLPVGVIGLVVWCRGRGRSRSFLSA